MESEEFSRRLALVRRAGAVIPLRGATMRALDPLGVRAAFFLAPLTRDPRVGRIVSTMKLSWIWERHYRGGLHLCDPLPLIALDRLEPFVWPDDISVDTLRDDQRRYLAIAARHGLARGVGVPCFGPDGRSGFLGAALEDGAVPDEQTLQRLHAIGQTSFQRYCWLIREAGAIPELSNRELEVLHWIGRGKSNSVIAQLLEISPSSVDVYVRRLFAKLDASDRTTASLKALQQGLIISADYERFVRDTAVGGDLERPLSNPDAGMSGNHVT